MSKEKEEKEEERKEKPRAAAKKAPPALKPWKKPVQRLAQEQKVSAPVLAGVMQAMGWAPETEVTPQDFMKKVHDWANKKVGG